MKHNLRHSLQCPEVCLMFVILKQPSIKASLVPEAAERAIHFSGATFLRIMIRNIFMIGPEVHFCCRIVITFLTVGTVSLKGKVIH